MISDPSPLLFLGKKHSPTDTQRIYLKDVSGDGKEQNQDLKFKDSISTDIA